MRIADLLESLHRLQKVTDDAKRQRIEQVLKAIDHDTDGVVDANLVLEVYGICQDRGDPCTMILSSCDCR